MCQKRLTKGGKRVFFVSDRFRCEGLGSKILEKRCSRFAFTAGGGPTMNHQKRHPDLFRIFR